MKFKYLAVIPTMNIVCHDTQVFVWCETKDTMLERLAVKHVNITSK